MKAATAIVAASVLLAAAFLTACGSSGTGKAPTATFARTVVMVTPSTIYTITR
jgi:hypothetical protein